ncbi:MAG: hypothetical protein OM95_06850 [Bdellovibrio sp. ArHS]|uniref:hypothetical protein n=1 Tax=Bdellovibrio sp. ArHS TaxID=1569284 RepID=UPI000583DD3A|nr:hypothetical protein [Bdellovibrio sp. ArHS]KHD88829.1 MAG: hypothetical protein OM95_06850 [Bdellovibrio sp. ArHS]
MRLFLLVGLVWALASCSNSGGGGSSASNDPYAGEYFLVQNIQGGSYVHALKIEGVNSFKGMTIFIPVSQTNLIYRKSVGTFTKNGNKYTVNYSYSTCGGTEPETFELSGDASDVIGVKAEGNATSLVFRNSKKYVITGLNENNIQSGTEDKSCNLLSKYSGKSRTVASKKKSFIAEIAE